MYCVFINSKTLNHLFSYILIYLFTNSFDILSQLKYFELRYFKYRHFSINLFVINYYLPTLSNIKPHK
jgi:hypothetical protein